MPDREPSIEAMILDKIDTLERNLNRRLDDQDRALQRVEAQTTKTNGRVTVLENARERGLGVIAAYRWLPVVLGSGLAAGLALLGTALLGGFH